MENGNSNEVKTDMMTPVAPTQAISPSPKKSNTGKIVIIVLSIVLVLAGVAAFIIMSKGDKKLSSKEIEVDKKEVYSNTVIQTFDKLDGVLTEAGEIQNKLQVDNALIFKGDIKIDTNIQEIKEMGIDISKFKLGMELGVNPEKEKILFGVDLNETIDAKLYVNNGKIYLVSNVINNPVDITEDMLEDSGVDGISEIFSAIGEVQDLYDEVELDVEKTSYMLDVLKKAIIESIDEDKIVSSTETYSVNGEKVEATKLTYTIDNETLINMIKKVAKDLKDDDKFIKDLAQLFDMDEADVKEFLNEVDELESSDEILDEKITINIYVKKGTNDSTGLTIEVGKEELLSFLSSNDNFELKINAGEEGELVLTQKVNNGNKDFSLKIDGEELITGTIRELSKDKLDFDIKFTVDGDEMELSVYLTLNRTSSSISGDYSAKLTFNGEYIKASGKYSLSYQKDLDNINVANAIKIDQINEDEIMKNIENKLASNNDLKSILEIMNAM